MIPRSFQIIVSVPLLVFAPHILALTETVDGITWTYTVSNRLASVGGSSYSSPAVPTSTCGAISIPASLGGYPVAEIGEYAFSNCDGLTSVMIPDSVTSIEWYAFDDCDGIKSMAIPASVSSIEKDAFHGCSNLSSFSVDENNLWYSSANGLLLSKDGNTLMFGVNGDVVIPNGVTSIGDHAFSGCRGLTSVTIPDSVTSIGDYAFSGCSSLKSIKIPTSVTSVGDGAFCVSGLKSVTIPNSVANIEDRTFSDCWELVAAKIPNSVTNIGERAFAGCGKLTLVIGNGDNISIDPSAFEGCDRLASVPKSRVKKQSSDNSSEASAEQGMKAMAAVLGILGTMSQMAEAERANEQGQREAAAAARAEDGYGRLYGGDNDGDNSRMQRQLEEQQRQIRQLQEQQQQKSSRVKICPYCGGSGRFGVSGHQLRDTPLGEALMPCQRCRGTGVMPDE